MKRIVGLIVRIGIVVGGLTMVAFTVTWRDSVHLPAQYMHNGQVLTQGSRWFPVVDYGRTSLTLRLDDGSLVTLPFGRTTPAEEAASLVFQPGILTTFANANLHWIILALFVLTPTVPLQAWRWAILMRCCGLPAQLWYTFRLHMAGLFFNTFMPGTTGGDVMKAYYAALGTVRKADTVVSVLVDRVVGLMGLIVLGVVASFWNLELNAGRDAAAKMWIVGGVFILMAVAYFSAPLRSVVGLNWALPRLPVPGLIGRLRSALAAYRNHKLALISGLGLAVAAHLLVMLSAALSAIAVGMTVSLIQLLATLPLVFFVGAIPLTFMGFGIMEPLAIMLLGNSANTTVNQIVTMLVLVRFYQILLSMPGAAFVVQGNFRFQEE